MAPLMAVTGMVAEKLEPPERPPPSELVYRRIEDRADRFALVNINSASYAVPSEWGREVAENSGGVWVGESFAHLGCVGGKPVTVSTTVRMGDALYVGWVATLPQHRRRGYAEAVVRHSLAEASRVHGGMTRTALHATPAGLPMYHRMGYRPVGRFIIYGLTDAGPG
jgi:GNAT superfamily N-acetyltransferase